MAVTANTFPALLQALATKQVNLSSDSLKVMLLSAYTFSAAHASMADVKGAGTEAAGTGYTAGGQALTSVSVSTSGTTTTITCANPSWATSTITAAHAVFFDAQGGTDAADVPMVHWDLGGSQSSTAGTFTLTINASGLIVGTSS